jgi:hypothetical protein
MVFYRADNDFGMVGNALSPGVKGGITTLATTLAAKAAKELAMMWHGEIDVIFTQVPAGSADRGAAGGRRRRKRASARRCFRDLSLPGRRPRGAIGR